MDFSVKDIFANGERSADKRTHNQILAKGDNNNEILLEENKRQTENFKKKSYETKKPFKKLCKKKAKKRQKTREKWIKNIKRSYTLSPSQDISSKLKNKAGTSINRSREMLKIEADSLKSKTLDILRIIWLNSCQKRMVFD